MKNNSSMRFDIASLFPKYVINSRGVQEPFDISNIKQKLCIDIGLDEYNASVVSDNVIKKILRDGNGTIYSSHIRDLVCAELSLMGLDKYKFLC